VSLYLNKPPLESVRGGGSLPGSKRKGESLGSSEPSATLPRPNMQRSPCVRGWAAQCFEGKALVNFICRDLGIRIRPEATAAAQRWMDVGVFYHVTKNAHFRDDSTLYRFARDEVRTQFLERERERERERGERVDLLGSHGRWTRPCLQTAHMAI
jgi:hypothetical protein